MMINNWNMFKDLTLSEHLGDKILKTAGEILNETGEQMLNRKSDIYEESKVVDKKKYTWKDIVRIDDKLYCEEFPISGEMDGPDIYCIGDFMKAVAEKHNCDTDDIETYMLGMTDISGEIIGSGLEFGAESCGCYIDGVAEWMID